MMQDRAAQIKQLRTRIAGKLRLGLYSRSMRYGLRRDLRSPLAAPSAKIPISVRPLVEDDIPVLLPIDDTGADSQDQLEIAWRRAFLGKGAKGCFVAVDQRNGTPCYMQWLMGSSENSFIRRLHGFPELGQDEALLENAYTPATYRGLGIMSAAMALIAERAADFGARYVLTFVEEHNIASLKGCERAGFYPHMLHHRDDVVFGLLKWDRFETLRDGDPRRDFRFYPAATG
jgi:RimJ/RimL family protein N-acetyltransferase